MFEEGSAQTCVRVELSVQASGNVQAQQKTYPLRFSVHLSTIHVGSFTHHQGPPLWQTFLVSNVQPAISISQRWRCPGRFWRQCPVRALAVTRAVSTPAVIYGVTLSGRASAVHIRCCRSSGRFS